MLNKDFAKIKDPDAMILNQKNKLMLKKYIALRKKLPPNPGHMLKEEILTVLNEFFKNLNEMQRKICHNWFNYQLTCIDYKLLPSAKIAEFAIKYNLQKNIFINKDGESVVLMIEDEDQIKLFYDKIKKNFGIEPKLVEINYGG